MGKYLPAQKRIVGVFGHHNSGKTTLLDAVLKNYYSGADRIGQRYLDSEPLKKKKPQVFPIILLLLILKIQDCIL